jgi:hypothetical protein
MHRSLIAALALLAAIFAVSCTSVDGIPVVGPMHGVGSADVRAAMAAYRNIRGSAYIRFSQAQVVSHDKVYLWFAADDPSYIVMRRADGKWKLDQEMLVTE